MDGYNDLMPVWDEHGLYSSTSNLGEENMQESRLSGVCCEPSGVNKFSQAF